MSSPTASPITPLKWLTGTLGVLLLLGSLAGFAYTGNSAWKLWQQTHPKAVSGKAAPAGTNAIRAARGTNAVRVPLGTNAAAVAAANRWRPKSPSMSSPNGRVVHGGNHCFLPGHPAAANGWKKAGCFRCHHRRAQEPPPRVQPALAVLHVLLVGPETRRLWTFGGGQKRLQFEPGANCFRRAAPAGESRRRDWKSIFSPGSTSRGCRWIRFFCAWCSLPVSDLDETLSMVELQLEKFSPLPVTADCVERGRFCRK